MDTPCHLQTKLWTVCRDDLADHFDMMSGSGGPDTINHRMPPIYAFTMRLSDVYSLRIPSCLLRSLLFLINQPKMIAFEAENPTSKTESKMNPRRAPSYGQRRKAWDPSSQPSISLFTFLFLIIHQRVAGLRSISSVRPSHRSGLHKDHSSLSLSDCTWWRFQYSP